MNEKILIDYIIADKIKQCFSIYGIEGTEDLINRCYSNNSIARKRYLEIYRKLLKGE